MKKLLLFIVFFSNQSYAQAADGAMDCTVTGNVVVASEEGKFKTYSSIEGGVKANEKVILSYTVSSESIYIKLERINAEKTIIIAAFKPFSAVAITANKGKDGGFILTDTRYNTGISFVPDYIRINEHGELFVKRYYKNDWHGIFSYVDYLNNSTQTLTLNCRHTNDKMDAAFKIFTGYKERK